MLVLACAVFLLLVMPAALLWLGRLIEANTDGRKRIQAERTRTATSQGEGSPGQVPWFRRPMRPAFGKPPHVA